LLILSLLIWSVGQLSHARSETDLVSRRVLVVTIAVFIVAVSALVITLLGRPSPGLKL
jgi:hypothetical protein